MEETYELQNQPYSIRLFISPEEQTQMSETESERRTEIEQTEGNLRLRLPDRISTSCPSLNVMQKPRRNSLNSENVSNIYTSTTNIGVSRMTKSEKLTHLRENLCLILSCIYAVFLVMLGAVIYVSDQNDEEQIVSQSFSCFISMVGLVWLIFLHVDLTRYKHTIEKKLHEESIQELDRISTITEVVINRTLVSETDTGNAPYRFLTGRQSGSFYLKIGTAAFCFGHLIHEGLLFGQHVFNFINDEKKQYNCSNPSNILLHIIRPIFSFYQLFIVFKYSNIIINRFKEIARFGQMHLIATCMCFWLHTIIQEALYDYQHKIYSNETVFEKNLNIGTFIFIIEQNDTFIKSHYCRSDSILSIRSLQAVPYLYPFTIEYNLILAGVWFVVWQHIGNIHYSAHPCHFRQKVTNNPQGSDEVEYQSNVTINADCHASNKGLFAGLCLLLITIITVIIFFVAITSKEFYDLGILLHTIQESVLTCFGLIVVLVAYVQISQLDINRDPITFLDDFLLFIPLPFFFINGFLSLVAAWQMKNYQRVALFILLILQVIIQTPFIIDGLRRCSNSNVLRFKKPGRELIIFLIICNLTIWIVNTFELKSVEHYYAQRKYYGHIIWMFVGHITLPLMLFYRFHSSVCLADIWKSAYEKEG